METRESTYSINSNTHLRRESFKWLVFYFRIVRQKAMYYSWNPHLCSAVSSNPTCGIHSENN
jgi:hypothetical protein